MGMMLALLLLVSGGVLGFWSAQQYRKDPAERPPAFMGRQGRMFLLLVSLPALPLFIVGAIYLALTHWVLCLIAVPVTLFVLGPLLSPLVVGMWVRPLYAIYNRLRDHTHSE